MAWTGGWDRFWGLLPREVLTLPFEDERLCAGPFLPRPAALLGFLVWGPSPQSMEAGAMPSAGSKLLPTWHLSSFFQ